MVMSRWSVNLTTLFLGRLRPKRFNQYLVHILLPVTDNCPTWISSWERMAVEMISSPISHVARPVERPPICTYQLDVHPTKLPGPVWLVSILIWYTSIYYQNNTEKANHSISWIYDHWSYKNFVILSPNTVSQYGTTWYLCTVGHWSVSWRSLCGCDKPYSQNVYLFCWLCFGL